jgi:hypothetical protein
MRDKLQGEVKKMLCMMRSLYSIGENVFPWSCNERSCDYESNNDYKAKTHEDALVLTAEQRMLLY